MEKTATIAEKIQQVIAEHLGLQVTEIMPESHLANDLGADSLDRLELQMALEDNFDLWIDDVDVDKLKTVQDCIEFIQKKKGEGA